MKRVPQELGKTGLRYSNKTLYDEEIQSVLRFPYCFKEYSKMKTDAIVSGSLLLIRQFIRKATAEIQPKGGVDATPEAKRKAELVREALFMNMDRSFDQVVSDIISFVENGFSFHEPTYRIRKGIITWKDFPTRHATTIKGFEFDNSGNVKTVIQWRPNTVSYNATIIGGKDIEIPYNRLLHFRTDSEKNNPLGKSILKNAYRSWYFKQILEEQEAIGFERNLGGLPSLGVPLEYMMADPIEDPEKYAQKVALENLLSRIRNNEQAGIMLPSDVDPETNAKLFTFELLQSTGSAAGEAGKVIERLDYRIAQSMLTDFIMIGSGSTGSFALSDNKVNTFSQSLEAYLEVIAEQFNRKAIPELYRLNKWDEEDLCRLTFKPISAATITEVGEFLEKTKNFITPDATLENAIRNIAGLPDSDKSTQYLDVPTTTHQAKSQRIGMEASAAKATTTPTETTITSDVDDGKEDEADELEKSLKGYL